MTKYPKRMTNDEIPNDEKAELDGYPAAYRVGATSLSFVIRALFVIRHFDAEGFGRDAAN